MPIASLCMCQVPSLPATQHLSVMCIAPLGSSPGKLRKNCQVNQGPCAAQSPPPAPRRGEWADSHPRLRRTWLKEGVRINFRTKKSRAWAAGWLHPSPLWGWSDPQAGGASGGSHLGSWRKAAGFSHSHPAVPRLRLGGQRPAQLLGLRLQLLSEAAPSRSLLGSERGMGSPFSAIQFEPRSLLLRTRAPHPQPGPSQAQTTPWQGAAALPPGPPRAPPSAALSLLLAGCPGLPGQVVLNISQLC